ncbi:DNRLRE domain-containing protein [Elongatibacter sediminis]|uniref:DNRLRE domain-containing protein n=1 Tax=Elongatibacter sediminis TaxID=3119006 RepID=A0AAW9R6Z9_9GAMM
MKILMIRVAPVLLGLLLTASAHAAAVTRGPYLQLQTDTAITVRWRTDVVTDSVVRFGPDPGNLDQMVTVAGSRTEHSVRLAGLNPAQQYWYAVGDSIGTIAGDASFHFQTAPTPGLPAATRIWVVGDSGTADANARAVRDAYKTWSSSNPADFWLMLGDNAYSDGTDAEYQAAVFDTYPEILRQLTLWSTLGNHDGHTADSATQTGPYYDIFDLPTAAEAGGLASGTEAYYSFDYANIHFVCLDSYDTDRSPSGTMLQWLESDLALNTQPWVIAYWHHPPYTKGSHNSDTEGRLIDMRQNALPILEAWGVDLVMTGHSHSYERSYLLDGHYGASTSLDPVAHVLDPGDGSESGDGAYEKPDLVAAQNAGAVYAVAGSSGKISGGALDHPAMFVSLNSLGSLVLDVSGNRMDVVFLDQTGSVQDEFTVLKTPDSDPPLIASATAEDATHVRVEFDEALDPVEANNAANYTITGLTVSDAAQQTAADTVRLTTSAMINGASYTLVVNHLKDVSGNTIAPDSSVNFDFFETRTVAFQDGLAPDPGYLGTADAYIRQASATTPHGLETSLQVDGDDPSGSGSDMSIVLSWDLSSIPPGSQVESAAIGLEVTNASGGSYSCYRLQRAWAEPEVTWNQAANGSPWSSPGALGAGDRDNQPLCGVSATATGPLTITLNAAGVATVQNWIDAPGGNHGIVISDPTTSDGADFHSRESGTAMARPRLEVTYRVPVDTPNADPIADFSFSCGGLDCDFTDLSSDSDGAIVAWDWDFGDGQTANQQHPSHSYTGAGDYTVVLTVTDDDGATDALSDTVSVSEPPAFTDALADADLPSAGSVSGTYADTHADDGQVQSITERESGGKKSRRYSYLEHTWRFQVPSGSAITLWANAWSGGSAEGDEFVFSWSTDNNSFTDLFTISSTDPASLRSATLGESGTIYVRVSDTDQTAGMRALDTVFVDQIYIRSENAMPSEPPAAPTGLQITGSTSSSLTLAWQHPSGDETGFDLQRAPGGSGNWAVVATPGGGSTGTNDTGLTPNTTYDYRVRATNAAGASAWSNVASGTTDPAPAISLDASGYKQRGVHHVDLTWTGAGGSQVDVVRDGGTIATVSNSGNYHDNTGNKGGATYIYRVCEAGTSTCSNDVTVEF